jgi:microcystin-dependent protein
MTIIGTYPPASPPASHFLPPGILVPFAGSTAPEGWLLCQGQAISRASYPALNAVLAAAGYPFGSGDGSTTFNLPDLRGRAPYGVGAGTPGVASLGASEGQGNIALRGPHHGHSIVDNGHAHYYSGGGDTSVDVVNHEHSLGNYGGVGAAPGGQNVLGEGGGWGNTAGITANHWHNFSTAGWTDNRGTGITVGSQGYSIQNAPSHLALNFLIKY